MITGLEGLSWKLDIIMLTLCMEKRHEPASQNATKSWQVGVHFSRSISKNWDRKQRVRDVPGRFSEHDAQFPQLVSMPPVEPCSPLTPHQQSPVHVPGPCRVLAGCWVSISDRETGYRMRCCCHTKNFPLHRPICMHRLAWPSPVHGSTGDDWLGCMPLTLTLPLASMGVVTCMLVAIAKRFLICFCVWWCA
jgi:hypothetical protein